MLALLLGCKSAEPEVFPELEEYEWGLLLSSHLREIGVEEVERVRVKERYIEDSETVTIITPERKLDILLSAEYIPKVQGFEKKWKVLTIAEYPKFFYQAPIFEEDIYDYKTGELIESKDE